MKKFILPVINLIALVLSAVVFGLGANTAVNFGSVAQGNWYQLVWTPYTNLEGNSVYSLIAILGFFFFVFAAFFALVTMVPFKGRKFGVCLAGALFIAAGVMFLLTMGDVFKYYAAISEFKKTDSFTAMAVLVFVAGGLELVGACIDFLPEKK